MVRKHSKYELGHLKPFIEPNKIESDNELLRMLKNVFYEHGYFEEKRHIHLDGNSLRSKHILIASVLIEEKGWVNFRYVEVDEQSAFYKGYLTEAGKEELRKFVKIDLGEES